MTAELVPFTYRDAQLRVVTIDGEPWFVAGDAAEARAIAANTEARLDAIEGKHDWFSAIAYARLNGLPTNSNYLRKLGACAGQIGRSHGVEPTQVQHQLYGWVNSWPAWVWDLAADGFAR